MKYQVRCKNCSKCFWLRGTFEADTNALSFGKAMYEGEECDCGDDLEVINEEEI